MMKEASEWLSNLFRVTQQVRSRAQIYTHPSQKWLPYALLSLAEGGGGVGE